MDDRRRHTRVELQSQVAVTHFDVVHQLKVANASQSGLFLEGDPRKLPEFSVGAEVSIRLFDEDLEEDEDLIATARVIRVVRGKGPVVSGVALEFVDLEAEDRQRLDHLLSRQGETQAKA